MYPGLGTINFLDVFCSAVSVNFHIYSMQVHESCRNYQRCRCDIDVWKYTLYIRSMVGRKFHWVKYNCINWPLFNIVGVDSPPCNSYPHFLYSDFTVYRGYYPAESCGI